MPGPAVIMSHADWLRRTAVQKWHKQSDKTRSPALVMVDNFVQGYELSKDPQNLEGLHEFLTAWVNGKLKRGVIDSIRDHDGAASELKRQVDAAVRLRDPIVWKKRYPNILIADDTYRGSAWVPDDFIGTARDSLALIESKPVGKKLLEDLEDLCQRSTTKKVVIQYSSVFSSAAPLDPITNESRKKLNRVRSTDVATDPQTLLANPLLVAKPKIIEGRRAYIGGGGTGCVVNWKHTDRGLDGRPTHIALAHELVHAIHYVGGMCYRAATGGLSDLGNTGIMEEEMRTVGFGPYAKESPSENAIRAEHNIPLRPTYNPDIDFTKVDATPFMI